VVFLRIAPIGFWQRSLLVSAALAQSTAREFQLAALESGTRVASISFLDGLAPEAHYGRAAHMASRGGAPSFSSGSTWATSLTIADDDHRTDRILAANHMSRSCAVSADDPS
jgi:hypothetical protein